MSCGSAGGSEDAACPDTTGAQRKANVTDFPVRDGTTGFETETASLADLFPYESEPVRWLPERSNIVANGHGPVGDHRLPVTTAVQDVELFLSPFSGMGRMAHVQRQLAMGRGVLRVRIGGLAGERANFLVTLDVGISLASLVLANTSVVSASPWRLELSLRSRGAGERSFRRPAAE